MDERLQGHPGGGKEASSEEHLSEEHLSEKTGGERERLAALRRYDILDTPPEACFDRITRLAAHLLGAPRAQISLIDAERQWAKSTYGGDREAGCCAREASWCARAIETPGVLGVEDAAQDERFAESRFAGSCFATEAPRIRFYAAAPLVTPEGARIGTLCVYGPQPRSLDEEQRTHLRDLAAMVMDELERRRSLRGARGAEEALRREKRFSDALIDGAPGFFVLFDQNGHILRWNEQFARASGYTDEEIARRHPLDFVAEAGRTAASACVAEAIEQGWARAEMLFETKQGTLHPYACVVRTITFEGRPCVLGMGVDVTERERAKRELRASEEKYARLFETANDAILLFEPESETILEANAKAGQMYGAEPSELVGQSLKAFTEDVARGERELREGLRNGHLQEMETMHRRADGTRIHVLVHASFVTYEGRRAVLSIHRDITRRKRAQARTKRLKTFYEDILDEVPVEIAVLDPDGRYRYMNRAGISDPEDRRWMVGKTDVDFARRRGRDPAPFRERRDWTLGVIERKEADQRMEVMTTASGEEKHLMRHEVPIFDGDGAVKYVIGYTVDLTERRTYEEGLRAAKEKAEQAAQVKDAIINNMSHEIRTPLASMIGFADVLVDDLGEGHDEAREFARIIRRSGQRLQQTLESVLVLAQLEADRYTLKREAVDVRAQVEWSVNLHQPQARENGLTLRMEDASAPSLTARADEAALDRVLTNLVGNALKFTREGGVTVTAGRLAPGAAPPGKRMGGPLEETPERIFIRVQDTGIGMAATALPGLFEEFEQESSGLVRQHQGAGLGLSITRRLVELMGGAVYVRSEKDAGTTVTVCLAAA